MDNTCGVYKIYNKINNKIYIGSSKNIERRIYTHFWHLKNGDHVNCHLQYAYNKYGEDNFGWEIVCSCSESEQFEKEQFYIDSLSPEYNIKPTADGTDHFSEETKRKMSEKMKELYANGYQFGKVLYDFSVYVYDIKTWCFVKEFKRCAQAVTFLYDSKAKGMPINRINKRIFQNRFVICDKKFDNKLDLINFVSENALNYRTNDGRLEYLVIIKNGYYNYARSTLHAIEIIGSGSRGGINKRLFGTLDNPAIYKGYKIFKINTFIPILEADLDEESLSLLSGKIEERPDLLDNIEITTDCNES